MARFSILALLCLALCATAYGYIGIEDQFPGGVPDGLFTAMGGVFGGEDGGDEATDEEKADLEETERELGPLATMLTGGGSGPLADKPLLRMMILRRALGGGQQQGFGPFSGLQRPSGSMARNMMLFRMLGKNMGEKFLKKAYDTKQSRRIYTFASSLGCDCSLEYIDDEYNLKGFSFDLINAVCEAAGKKCAVMYDAGTNCYSHVHGEHGRAGDGLMNKYYDGCLTWMRTHERERSVSFTAGYSKIKDNQAHFYVLQDNPNAFNQEALADANIGFLDGWVSDEYCLANPGADSGGFEGVRLHPDNTHYYATRKELFTDVQSGKLAAAFLVDLSAKEAEERGFEKIGPGISCGVDDDLHIMTRKDSDVSEWFDATLAEMKSSGAYYGLCARSYHAHLGKGGFNCVGDDE